MAMSAYYLKGVQSKNVELMQIFAGIMPFLGIVIFRNVFNVYVSWHCFVAARNIICKLIKLK